jgi:hypothetical protein
MDKRVARDVKKLAKNAAKAALLNERAAALLARAGKIEAAQKVDVRALIVRLVVANGLDQLAPAMIVDAFAKLGQAFKEDGHPARSVMVTSANEADRIERGGSTHADSANRGVDLIVKIGRNTTEARFALLNEHLHWSGKDGRWSGEVTPAALKMFEVEFEGHRLVYARPMPAFGDSGLANTATESERVAVLSIQQQDSSTVSQGAVLAPGPKYDSAGAGELLIAPVDIDEAVIGEASSKDAVDVEDIEIAADHKSAPALSALRSPFGGLYRRAGRTE